MHTPQGSKACWIGAICKRTEKMPDLRNIHEMGGSVVSLLRIQAQDKTTQFEVQGKITYEKETGC
jgi:hypothetical protein